MDAESIYYPEYAEQPVSLTSEQTTLDLLGIQSVWDSYKDFFLFQTAAFDCAEDFVKLPKELTWTEIGQYLW